MFDHVILKQPPSYKNPFLSFDRWVAWVKITAALERENLGECMRRLIAGLVVGVFLAVGNARSEGLLGNEIAIGMATPAPTGITVKLWTSRLTALDVFSNWDASNKRLDLHLDYLTHNFEQYEVEGATMPFFYGFGMQFSTREGSATKVGFRIPVGVSYLWNSAPLDFFAEVAPRAGIIPTTSFALDLMIGVRYRIIP